MPQIASDNSNNSAKDVIKPYRFHGLDVSLKDGEKQANCNCPFCLKEGKFSINVDTGLWRCLVCGTGNDKGGGNLYTFIRALWQHGDKATNPPHYKELAANRKLLYADTVMQWEAARHPITNEWCIPGYSVECKQVQLYRYAKLPGKNSRSLMATPTLKHGIFANQHGNNKPNNPKVYLFEGPWDAMAFWEVLRAAKQGDDNHLHHTASPEASLLAQASVMAVPGCNVFNEQWATMFAGKDVYLMFDNDHDKEVNGKVIESPGYAGMRRVAQLLAKSEEPPNTIHIIKWGNSGTHNPELPNGYDVRDHLAQGNTITERIKLLEQLLAKLEPIPEDWVQGRTKKATKAGDVHLAEAKCESWKQLNLLWRKAMRWTDGLDCALSVMLASITSTKAVGDQLWCKIIGPASCGKSTLCEAVSVNRKFVTAKSTIRGFHSGFQTDRKGTEDNSLIGKLNGMTLVTKDGDTLLQSPNLGQVLSEARDIYDTTSRTYYRNKMSKEYHGIRMTWILCGTSSLRQLDSSELGERFLDCVIMDGIDDEMEDEVLMRVAYKAERNMALEAGSSLESQNDPDYVKAMQATGGYVTYLRENAQRLLAGVEATDNAIHQCVYLGKFVAFARARPSTRQDESVEREFGSRLVSQLTRLAKCLAVVLNRPTIDEEVLRRTRKVALDTARGKTLDLIKRMFDIGPSGMENKSLALLTGRSEAESLKLLRFLRNIGAAEVILKKLAPGVNGKPRWRLTQKLAKLYSKIMGVPNPYEIAEVDDEANNDS